MSIINSNEKFDFKLDKKTVIKKYIRGSGNGGQAINKTSSNVQLIHNSGVIIKCQETRSRTKNEEIAWKRLEEKISKSKIYDYEKSFNNKRFDQIGYGNGRNKRTYRIKENIVIDHDTNKKCSFKDFSRGEIEKLS